MNTLHVLPVHVVGDEPLASLVSRLAARNAGGYPAHLADLLGLQWQDVIDGTDHARAVFARCLEFEPELVGAAGPRRVQGNSFIVGSEPVPRLFLRRARIFACPTCLQEDHAKHAGRPEVVCTQRAEWQISHIRTCRIHESSLVQIGNAVTPDRLGDFARAIRYAWPHMDAYAARAIARAPSPLETYIANRIAGRSGPAWLDANTLYGAARACEMLGAAAIHGAHVLTDGLDEDGWYSAGAVGFEIASDGETRIRALLAELREDCPSDAGQIGLRAIFGTLHEWLAHGDDIGEAGPLRDVLRRFVLDTMPVGPGDVVLGEPVVRRTMHSIYSLHKKTGLHWKRLRKLLEDADLVAGEDNRSDHLVVFPAEAGEAAARRVAGGLSLKQVEAYMNCPRPHPKLLEESGFIRPVIDAEHRGRLAKHAFAPAELDDFLGRLLAGTVPMANPEPHFGSIPEAMKRACCSAMEIVRLVLHGKLQNLGGDPEVEGYLSLLVDVEELKTHVRLEADPSSIPLRQAERRLRTSTAVIKALISPGPNQEPPILEPQTVVNPVNRCPQVVIPFAAIEAFERDYIGLMQLAKETGVHHVQLRKLLDGAGIEPAFDPDRVAARYYRREKVAAVLPLPLPT